MLDFTQTLGCIFQEAVLKEAVVPEIAGRARRRGHALPRVLHV